MGKQPLKSYEKRLLGNRTIQLIPRGRIHGLERLNRDFKATFQNLPFRDQLTEEETGDQSLLALAFFRGKMMNGKFFELLYFLPANLKKKLKNWCLSLQNNWQLESALVLHIQIGYQVKFDSEALQEQVLEYIWSIEFRIGLTNYWKPISISTQFYTFWDRIGFFPQLSEISVWLASFQDGKIALKTYALLANLLRKEFFISGLWEIYWLKTTRVLWKHYYKSFFHQDMGRYLGRPLSQFFPWIASQENVFGWKWGKGKASSRRAPDCKITIDCESCFGLYCSREKSAGRISEKSSFRM